MLRVIWGSCQAARTFPRMPPGPLGRGVPKARKPKGAKSPAGRSKARRAEGAQAGREVFPRPRGKTFLLCGTGLVAAGLWIRKPNSFKDQAIVFRRGGHHDH